MVLVAALAGTLHAAFSLYWALGGQWLLDTVGDWAVRLTVEEPLLAGLGLAALASLKLLAAWIPVLVDAGHLRGRAGWRRVSWIGGIALVAYGGLNTLVALAVVSGLATPDGGYDHAAMIGHAALWDPLFLLWGAALVASLAASRER
ncbi:MAG: DUF3995 domain-containing protein [Solirubrobacteraceae bacterium]|nr:DUF3995 domain-containing protein [Solirubrobacteraceae bacterium]